MTEKRFTLEEFGLNFIVNDNGRDLTAKQTVDRLNELNDENKQLKQRNENQYQQLNELWGIIEEENWEKLIAMKKQLKEDEERLQREWKCYE